MPHKTEPDYRFITTTQLAPTFGAEVSGVDFSDAVPAEVFAEIKDAIGKVSTTKSYSHLPALIAAHLYPSIPKK